MASHTCRCPPPQQRFSACAVPRLTEARFVPSRSRECSDFGRLRSMRIGWCRQFTVANTATGLTGLVRHFQRERVQHVAIERPD
jgi:hypothetical protein